MCEAVANQGPCAGITALLSAAAYPTALILPVDLIGAPEQVVAALSNRPRGHVPHRSSRLTSVLKEALGGNCRTTLVANIMLEDDHSEETLSTLRFAARMQSVANVAVANKHEEISAADALRQSQAKVAELKRELAMHDQLANRSAVSYEPMGAQQKLELRRQVQAYLSREVDELDILSLRQVRETFEQFRVLYDEQARAAVAP